MKRAPAFFILAVLSLVLGRSTAYAFSEVQRSTIPAPDNAYFTTSAVDTNAHVAYLGNLLGELIRFDLPSMTLKDSSNIHSMIGANFGPINAIQMSPDNQFVLVWTNQYLAKLNTTDLSQIGGANLFNTCRAPVVDWTGGMSYCPSYGYITRTRLSDMRVFTEWVFSGIQSIGPGITDGTYLYVLAQQTPPYSQGPQILLQIRLSDGMELSRRLLPSTDPLTYNAVWWDLPGNALYLGAQTTGGQPELVKLQLSTLTVLGHTSFAASGPVSSGFLDSTSGYGYFGCGAALYKVRLVDMSLAGQAKFAGVIATDYQIVFRDSSNGQTYAGYNFKGTLPIAGLIRLDMSDDAGSGVPAPPLGVQASSAALSVVTQWNAVPGSTGYNLYWSTSAGVTTATGKRVSNVVSPYTLTSLAAGTTYYLAVTAKDAAGESILSAEVSAAAAPLPVAPPPAPSGVQATSGVLSITAQWNTVAGSTGYNL